MRDDEIKNTHGIIHCVYSGVIQNSAIAYPQQKQAYSHHKMMMQPGLHAFGTIASLQNDKEGDRRWIVSGI